MIQSETLALKSIWKRLPKRVRVLVLIGLFGLVCVIGFAIWMLRLTRYDAYGLEGGYSIKQAILTDGFDASGYPTTNKNKFNPSDQIIAWVSTIGAEGIIGMRWYYGDELIFEYFDKTFNNQLYTFIQSNPSVRLEEGSYRVEIHTTGKTPQQTLYFSIEEYHPEVSPPQPTPNNHQDKENSPFIEVPFAYDQVWLIENISWQINEVKITFLDDETAFVSIAVETDMDLKQLSQNKAFTLTKPIAEYAIINGYLDQAESLQIDGEFYSFGKMIYVNLVNNDPDKSEIPVYRVGFNIIDLFGPQS